MAGSKRVYAGEAAGTPCDSPTADMQAAPAAPAQSDETPAAPEADVTPESIAEAMTADPAERVVQTTQFVAALEDEAPAAPEDAAPMEEQTEVAPPEPQEDGLVTRSNFGWLPDIPDHRDMRFALNMAVPPTGMPAKLDLSTSGFFPEAYDQGEIGSCVACAVGAAIEYAMARRPNDPEVSDFLEEDRKFRPSRLFLYYGAREIIGLQKEDSGCHIRDCLKVAYNIGAPRETGWKYDVAAFTKKPPKRQYKSAPYHKISRYRSVAVDAQAVKNALYAGLPVIFGVAVFDSFFWNPRGDIPMPRTYEQMLGGHAMLIVGYDDATRRFKFLNSWGPHWGRDGYGTIPYEYVGNRSLGSDYWTLEDELYKERMA